MYKILSVNMHFSFCVYIHFIRNFEALNFQTLHLFYRTVTI